MFYSELASKAQEDDYSKLNTHIAIEFDKNSTGFLVEEMINKK